MTIGIRASDLPPIRLSPRDEELRLICSRLPQSVREQMLEVLHTGFDELRAELAQNRDDWISDLKNELSQNRADADRRFEEERKKWRSHDAKPEVWVTSPLPEHFDLVSTKAAQVTSQLSIKPIAQELPSSQSIREQLHAKLVDLDAKIEVMVRSKEDIAREAVISPMADLTPQRVMMVSSTSEPVLPLVCNEQIPLALDMNESIVVEGENELIEAILPSEPLQGPDLVILVQLIPEKFQIPSEDIFTTMVQPMTWLPEFESNSEMFILDSPSRSNGEEEILSHYHGNKLVSPLLPTVPEKFDPIEPKQDRIRHYSSHYDLDQVPNQLQYSLPNIQKRDGIGVWYDGYVLVHDPPDLGRLIQCVRKIFHGTSNSTLVNGRRTCQVMVSSEQGHVPGVNIGNPRRCAWKLVAAQKFWFSACVNLKEMSGECYLFNPHPPEGNSSNSFDAITQRGTRGLCASREGTYFSICHCATRKKWLVSQAEHEMVTVAQLGWCSRNEMKWYSPVFELNKNFWIFLVEIDLAPKLHAQLHQNLLINGEKNIGELIRGEECNEQFNEGIDVAIHTSSVTSLMDAMRSKGHNWNTPGYAFINGCQNGNLSGPMLFQNQKCDKMKIKTVSVMVIGHKRSIIRVDDWKILMQMRALLMESAILLTEMVKAAFEVNLLSCKGKTVIGMVFYWKEKVNGMLTALGGLVQSDKTGQHNELFAHERREEISSECERGTFKHFMNWKVETTVNASLGCHDSKNSMMNVKIVLSTSPVETEVFVPPFMANKLFKQVLTQKRGNTTKLQVFREELLMIVSMLKLEREVRIPSELLIAWLWMCKREGVWQERVKEKMKVFFILVNVAFLLTEMVAFLIKIVTVIMKMDFPRAQGKNIIGMIFDWKGERLQLSQAPLTHVFVQVNSLLSAATSRKVNVQLCQLDLLRLEGKSNIKGGVMSCKQSMFIFRRNLDRKKVKETIILSLSHCWYKVVVTMFSREDKVKISLMQNCNSAKTMVTVMQHAYFISYFSDYKLEDKLSLEEEVMSRLGSLILTLLISASNRLKKGEG